MQSTYFTLNVCIFCLRNLVRRLEKAGHSEDLIEEIEEKRFSYRPEHTLVDGTPGVHAKEVGSKLKSKSLGFCSVLEITGIYFEIKD